MARLVQGNIVEPVNKTSLVMCVNNLGSLTNLELNTMSGALVQRAVSDGYTVARLYVGSFCTALDMKGVSVALLLASKSELDLLDSSCDAPGWLPPLLKFSPGREVYLPKSSSFTFCFSYFVLQERKSLLFSKRAAFLVLLDLWPYPLCVTVYSRQRQS